MFKIDPANTDEDNEKYFLQYIQKNNSGLKLFKGNDTFTNWNPIKVDTSLDKEKIINNPCK